MDHVTQNVNSPSAGVDTTTSPISNQLGVFEGVNLADPADRDALQQPHVDVAPMAAVAQCSVPQISE